ncbi:MAG: glycosyltransferase family 61 protein [Bacteroidota bacterium]
MMLINEKLISLQRDAPIFHDPADALVFEPDLKKAFLTGPVLKFDDAYTYHRTIIDLSHFKIYNSYTHYHWNYRFFFLQIYRRMFSQKIRKEVLKIDKAIWITDSLLGNYYHWLIDCLGRYIQAEAFVSGHIVLIPEAFRYWKPIPEILNWLNIPFIYYDSYKVYKIRELLLPGFCCKNGDQDPGIISKLSKKFLRGARHPAFRKIYASRKKANYRFVLNEAEVIACLEKWDIEIHCFEDYDFEKQNKLMNECKLLIGLHGAGLANMVMMPPGGGVIELKNTREAGLNHYFNLANTLEFRYSYVPAFSNDGKTLNSNFIVDIPILKDVLWQTNNLLDKAVQ